ncbi:ribosomal protein S5 domain 2-type protein [Vararia minispora EC-137]|uniref:Ribosomal protein S5 domain 2-type protein n=1 Tax=Vararia minispora EC-137 TaxID=1314806 RepID=A0ACB8QYX8_9AGAM|nr:ribosomal protein S5 domain 2-type protein [Vararia minispora EC-137]
MASLLVSDTLRALTFQRLHPRTYLERLLAEDVRPDGRLPSEWRDISVNVGSISTADGSALVRIGDTTIVCGVKAEIAEPELDLPDQGFLVPNLDLTAMSSPKFKSGPPSEEAQVLSDRLNDALLAANVVPLESLCIQPGKAVWVLYVDATCINYDGNAFDATLVAMVAALKNTTLPKAIYIEERGRTTCTRKVREPLKLNCSPVAYTMGVFGENTILLDPMAFEEPLLDASLTIVLDEKRGVLFVSEIGYFNLAGEDLLTKCIQLAKQQHEFVANRLYGG